MVSSNDNFQSRAPPRVLADLSHAPVVLATITVTCAMSLLQVLGRSVVDLHPALEVQPGFLSRGELWRPLTANLVHIYGLPHLAANMIGLAIAGPPVERAYGRLGFLAIYGVSGWIAWAAHAGWGHPGSGASAALVGVFAALLVSAVSQSTQAPRRRQTVIVASCLSLAWLLSGPVLDGFVLPGAGPIDIADDVHVVGFVVGLLLSSLMLFARRVRSQFGAV
jgi:membrane associated rhomboid family serine protease